MTRTGMPKTTLSRSQPLTLPGSSPMRNHFITPIRSLRWTNKLAIKKANVFAHYLRRFEDADTRGVVTKVRLPLAEP